jgi:hypothetical protein
MAITDIIEESEMIETGAPSIKYKGDRPLKKEEMKMAGPDWYIKRIENLMYNFDMDYDEAGEIAYDSDKYYDVIGSDPGDMGDESRNMDQGIPNTKTIKNQPHMLAYITPGEAKDLEKLGGRETMTPEGIPAYPPDNWAPSSPSKSSNKSSNTNSGGGGGGGNIHRGPNETSSTSGPVDKSSALQTYNTKKATGRLGRQDPMGGELQYRNGVLIDETGRPVDDTFRGGFTGDLTDNEKTLETFIDSEGDYPAWTPAWVKAAAEFNRTPNRKYFIENVLRAGKIPGVDYSMLGKDEFDIEQAYKDYMSNRLAGKTDAMGNPTQGFSYDDGKLTGNFMDNGGGDNYIPGDGGSGGGGGGSDDDDEDDWYMPLAFRAEGGRVGRAYGGIMGDDGRRAYGLGSIFKKVKKVFKSPLGKMALLGGLGMLTGGAGAGSFMGKLKGNSFLKSMLLKGGKGAWTMKNLSPWKAIGGISTLSGLMAAKNYKKYDDWNNEDDGTGLGDLNQYRQYGIQAFAEGGKPEAGLMDMGGMEKDYREDGGFVPIGGKEKADDVPARLSKNEFVMTADAVRGAGDGDIDKGAEVMYNVMKNLEAGGGVSEETQGLDGAREMFQTSQRLEEVL